MVFKCSIHNSITESYKYTTNSSDKSMDRGKKKRTILYNIFLIRKSFVLDVWFCFYDYIFFKL